MSPAHGSRLTPSWRPPLGRMRSECEHSKESTNSVLRPAGNEARRSPNDCLSRHEISGLYSWAACCIRPEGSHPARHRTGRWRHLDDQRFDPDGMPGRTAQIGDAAVEADFLIFFGVTKVVAV